MADSRMKNAKRNMLGGLVNKIVNLLLPFLTRTALIYFLGALYLGLNSLFSAILTMLSLAELGFGAAMVFSMYEPIAKHDDDLVCALLALYRKIYRITGAVILTLGLGIMFFLPKLIKGEVPNDINIYWLYLLFLGNTVLSYFLFAYKSSILTADQRSDIKSNIQSVLTILSTASQLVVLVIFKNYYLYCIIWPIFTVINNLVTNRIVKKKYPQYYCHGCLDKSQITDIKKRVGGLFIYKLCYVFRDTFGSVVISSFLGLVALANYNNYFYIINALTGIMTIIKTSITASVGNSIAVETQEKNYNDFKVCQMLYMWISVWCTVTLYCLFQPFIKLWIGESYLFSDEVMLLFCILFFSYKAGDICAVYRQAAGLWWQDRYRPIVEAVTNVVLSVSLVQVWGVSGVLISTIICLILINSIWASRVLYRNYFDKYNQREYIGRIAYYWVVMFVSLMITGFVCRLVHLEGVMNLIVCFAICVVIPNAIILAGFKILPEFSMSVHVFKRILKKE